MSLPIALLVIQYKMVIGIIAATESLRHPLTWTINIAQGLKGLSLSIKKTLLGFLQGNLTWYVPRKLIMKLIFNRGSIDSS